VNDFVERCQREWKRLRVPDSVANEMAADLMADLKQAEAEGASAEEVLGSGASDPHSFAASWAAERGVIPPPRLTTRLSRRLITLAAIAALTVTAIGAALVVFASTSAPLAVGVPPEFAGRRAPESVAIALHPPRVFRSNQGPASVWIALGSDDGRVVRLTRANDSGVVVNLVGAILLGVGLAGVIASIGFLFWSSRPRLTTGLA
jgi:hypothetical protein